MISFKWFIKSPSRKGRYVDADMLVASWFSRQADGNKEPSPLTLWKKRGRRWFMGVAFPLVQSLHGKVLHECIQGIFSPPFPGALFRLALLLAPLSSRLSISSASPLFFSLSRPRLPRCFFLARASITECIGTSEHPLVIVVANPLAAAGICRLPFASYRSLKPNEHFGHWRYTVRNFWESPIRINVCMNTASRYIKIRFGRNRCYRVSVMSCRLTECNGQWR